MMRREFLSAIAATPLIKTARTKTSSPFMQTDCHAHIFIRGLTLAEARRYTPDYDASLDAYLEMLKGRGMARGVLVQPSFLGEDNSYLLKALTVHSETLRGVIVVPPSTDFSQLQRYDALGVRGVRLNLIGQSDPDLQGAEYKRFFRHIADLRWHVEVQAEAHRLPPLWEAANTAGAALVIDHFGRPDPKLGVKDPAFLNLIEIGPDQNLYVKLSGAYRLAPGAAGDEMAKVAASLLLSSLGPGKLLWGSDWPHTQFETVASPTAARAALDTWIPNMAQRVEILTETPQAVFRFPPSESKASAHSIGAVGGRPMDDGVTL